MCALDYDEWKWAVALVKSRSITLVDENGNKFVTVIPFFDFFNHVASTDEKVLFRVYGSVNSFHGVTKQITNFSMQKL